MKVFLIEWSSKPLASVAIELHNNYKWEILYWTHGQGFLPDCFKNILPNTIFHENHFAARGIEPTGIKYDLIIPDKVIIDKLSLDETVAMKMMDRMDAGGLNSYQKRKDLYINLLTYWYSIIVKHKPDCILHSSMPHLVYDYIIYAISKYMSLPQLFFGYTGFSSRLFVYRDFLNPREIVDLSKMPLDNNNIYNDSSGDIEKELERVHMKTHLEGVPFYFRDAFKKNKFRLFDEGFNIKVIDIIYYIKFIIKLFVVNINYLFKVLFSRQDTYLIESNGFFYKQPKLIILKTIFWKFHHKLKKLKLYYEKKSIKAIPSKKYIYLALQYTPEASNCPGAHTYSDQKLLIKNLHQHLPSDWLLLVREHPGTFISKWPAENNRSKVFYDEILELKNARLVSTDIDSFDLIDRSEAVVTQTGTVGWEAINRGKPAYVYGYPWYLGFPGVYDIKSNEDLEKAIKEVCNGILIDMKAIKYYTVKLLENSIYAAIEPAYITESKIDPSHNVENLVNGILISVNSLG